MISGDQNALSGLGVSFVVMVHTSTLFTIHDTPRSVRTAYFLASSSFSFLRKVKISSKLGDPSFM